MDEKSPFMSVFAFAYDNYCFRAYKNVSHLPSQRGIFVFTFTVKRFHIYRASLRLVLKVFTFTGPYYIFTFRGATVSLTERSMSVLLQVFRYNYSSPACSNSAPDFSVPQRSSGAKKPEQRSVSHRLGPDFLR